MGGAMAARSLAEAGYKVLLVDRGYKELCARPPDGTLDDALIEGKWPGPIACEIDGVRSHHIGIFGAGLGGSTNLYAAALERFDRCDVESLPESPHPTGGWAIRYDQLLPYYKEAERMLHVSGTADPLNPDSFEHIAPPPALGPTDTQFIESFAKGGMHAYRLHVGIRYRPGCDECLGRLCLNNCRADARSVVTEARVQPVIMERTEAVRLEAAPDKISKIILRQGEKEMAVRAKIFILAAGAVHTAKLLLQSKSAHWPDGVANRFDRVGRNLMFHVARQFIMWPRRNHPSSGPRKSISFRDFYRFGGERLGSVQSSGFEADYGVLVMCFLNLFDSSRHRKLRFIRPFLRIPAALTATVFGRGTIFSCCTEDLPYPDNRVMLDPNESNGVVMKYAIPQELRDRVFRFQELLKQRLDRKRMLFLTRDVALNLSHACGTCTMGNDPCTSVIDRDCRAHGITNLFIADASFMPTSAAINPSLTIAANALRVADGIKSVLAGDRLTQSQN
jgi:choline dehydrogenase-like flavoprotein